VDDLLEPVLRALEGVCFDCPPELRREQPFEPCPRGVDAEGEVDRAGERLERRREDRRATTGADAFRPLAQTKGAAQADAAGDSGKTGR